jgi:FKBP-type peptidyl-prolyl cis-trans isomerase
MKSLFALLVLGCLLLTACSKETEKTELKTDTEKASYAIGLEVGASLKNFQSDIDLPSLYQGIKDTLLSRNKLLTAQQADEVMRSFTMRMREQHEAKTKELAEKNRQEGETFLQQNKTRAGVVTTASGLQYEVLSEGNGPIPAATDQVTVHYRGTLIDGTEFDSSHKRGEPATFPVKGVIAGWTEALQLMKVGSKCRLYIPSQLAYGERGAGAQIGPNSTLIFEVELLGIKKK